ncbi:MAG TPA: peptide chain release factor N(5)-glutamine methyltransferase [Tepidisphaeraceae bacterium]|nr:peptide chain release factor N(5)-glutamine methyltransferase [Tepidisphaeraceae bacterium]
MPDGGTWTVRKILEWTTGYFTRKNVDPPRLSAELLLSHVLKAPRIKLYTNYERPLSEQELTAYRDLVRRAGEQEPIAYLTGTAHFFNLEFEVTRDVLIPRPDTETLVENVLQFVRHQPGFESPRVLDLCTGSGCIAAAIAHHLKSAVVTATDISPAAVAVARKNIERLGLGGRVLVKEGDLFEPLAKMVDVQPFQLIVSNPPYIPTAQIETLDRSVREYEPIRALDGGLDGLSIHRRILAEAPARLVTGGRIYLEIAFDQGELARQVAGEYEAFEEVRILKDFGGRDRVLTAKRM